MLTRSRPVAIAIVLAVSIACAWAYRAIRPASTALPTPPEGVRYQSLSWTAEDWLREGYVEMVSPIRPPSSEDGHTRIAVYVRFPASGRIRALESGEGWTLALPVGTSADRVELYGDGPRDAAPSAAWRVLDVRGISIVASGDASGRQLRVLRPKGLESGELFGITWPWGGAQSGATAILGELVLRRFIAAPDRPAERERAAVRLRRLNDCPACHVPRSPGRRTERDPGIVNRGTDASGLFQVASVLRDRLPFETYRPRDMNRGDPLIARFCGVNRVDDLTARCPDGSILEGELNVREGLKRGDPHTRRVCESRRALARHLEESGLVAFREALTECDIGRP